MQLKHVSHYLANLIKEGHKWQYLNINGKGKSPLLYFTGLQWVVILISGFGVVSLPLGFNKDFIGYTIASLSIFIGLFLTLILSVFDKFQTFVENNKSQDKTEKTKIILIQRRNFSKQFTSLTSYSIILSIFCIFLLSLSLLFESFNANIYTYSLTKWAEIQPKNILLLLKIFGLAFYRFCLIYFLLDFLLITLYAVTSIFSFIMINYDSEKI